MAGEHRAAGPWEQAGRYLFSAERRFVTGLHFANNYGGKMLFDFANPGIAGVKTRLQAGAPPNRSEADAPGSAAAPERRVGICMERSADLVVAILGVLKAGAAYVPLPTNLPPDRLALAAEDAALELVLTQTDQLAALPPNLPRVVCLDRDRAEIQRQPEHNPATAVTAQNLMYLMMTSGSTGRPNGVMIEHRAIANFLHGMRQAFPLAATDRVLQTVSFGFDVSVREIFWPLISGAQLVLPPALTTQNPALLAEEIERHQITQMRFFPTLLEQFLEQPGLEQKCRSLQRVFCGGETLSTALQERFFARLNAELYNTYGPTEAAVNATVWHCRRDDHRALVPIGRPLANVEVYVLDRHLQPAPVGVPGELCIAGAGLARGYWNRPELTREKFIEHEFEPGRKTRLYRTGDRARYLPDGAIEFLGRADHQIKLRGYRIELGEIEAALEQHPDLREAVVLAREDQTTGKRLVAYAVARDGAAPGAPDLRRFLQAKLPEYMVPAAFVFLAEFPLTPNGKIDTKALPAPGQVRPELDSGFAAPRNEAEAGLAKIWAQLLGLERVGVNDNFFELGGHSLLLTQLASRVREQFQVDLSLRSFFEAPTIAGLASSIQSAGRNERLPALPTANPRRQAQDLLRQMSALSDEEITVLLKKVLVEGEVRS
jgi:amino acid adenylation domain-containing protein